jgi:MFS family permease
MVTKASGIGDQESPSRAADIGLVVVHGIGRQKRGETAKRLAEDLADAPPTPIPLPSGRNGFRIGIGDVCVIVREATWADRSDLTNPPRVRDSKAVLRQLFRTLVEVGNRLGKDLHPPWKAVLGILFVITLASHLVFSGWMTYLAWLNDPASDSISLVDPAAVKYAIVLVLGPLGLTLFAIISRLRSLAFRVVGVMVSIILAPFVYLAVYLFFSLPLFYLLLFTLVAIVVNLLAIFVVNPPLRWIGEVLQRLPKVFKRVANGYNIVVNAMLVIPVHALLQASKAYVNLFSVFMLGGGDGERKRTRGREKSPKRTRPQVVLWGLVVTVAFVILLFLSEILTLLMWLPLTLDEHFNFFSIEWWFMLLFVAVLITIAYVPLGLLLDVSNYQVAAPEERQSVFDDVIENAVVDLTKAGCAELHIFGHSLGSVLAYDWLWKDREVGTRHAPITMLHTAGSPLNKFWFLDHTIEERSRDRTPIPVIGEGCWKNYWSWMDPISGKLRRYPSAEDVRIANPGGFLLSHIKYWDRKEVRESVRLHVKSRTVSSRPESR